MVAELTSNKIPEVENFPSVNSLFRVSGSPAANLILLTR